MAARNQYFWLPMLSFFLFRHFPCAVKAFKSFHETGRFGCPTNNAIFDKVSSQPVRCTFIHFSSQKDDSKVSNFFAHDSKNGQPVNSLYQEWTLDQDKLLWESASRDKLAVTDLASLLGRGLRSIEARLSKLKDVNSLAYKRLFADGVASVNNETEQGDIQKKKLMPAGEVLRRIRWDDSLQAEHFSILYYDRVQDTIVESPVTAPNDSINGKETLFVNALPEHRIVIIKYRDRVVWDRERRIDRVFSEEGIKKVIDTYNEWEEQQRLELEWNRLRIIEVSTKIESILGVERFDQLQQLLTELQSAMQDPNVSMKIRLERYVQSALALFRQAQQDTTKSLNSITIPIIDHEALDLLSEHASLFPDDQLRLLILQEISIALAKLEGKKPLLSRNSRELPDINEADIEETFVRGSGPGGQKVNKTSNRVVLVHKPTRLRVECQDTRSLEQNRKIARKRLRQKLDDYLHGNQSRQNLKAQEAAAKKGKAKARSRSRHRRKRIGDFEDNGEDGDDE